MNQDPVGYPSPSTRHMPTLDPIQCAPLDAQESLIIYHFSILLIHEQNIFILY